MLRVYGRLVLTGVITAACRRAPMLRQPKHVAIAMLSLALERVVECPPRPAVSGQRDLSSKYLPATPSGQCPPDCFAPKQSQTGRSLACTTRGEVSRALDSHRFELLLKRLKARSLIRCVRSQLSPHGLCVVSPPDAGLSVTADCAEAVVTNYRAGSSTWIRRSATNSLVFAL